MKTEKQKADYNHIAAKLIEYVEQRSTDMADGQYQVASDSYLDEQRWRKEMDKIFKRLPVLVGASSELSEPGRYVTRDFAGVPLLITRLRDGSVRVMLNACAHRGMKVADGQGKCEKFACPYHAWLYGNDGSLQRVYGEATYGQVDKAAMSLTQLPVHEEAGLIFAVLTPGVEIDFKDFYGEMLDDLTSLGFQDWHYCGNRVIQGANWKIAYDGYLEGYHFAAAHPKTINERTHSNVMQFHAHGPHQMIGFPQRTIDKLREVPADELHQYENEGYDFVRALFPNTSIFVAPEITQIAQLIPGPTVGENTTILHFINRKAPETDEDKQANETMMDWLRDVVQVEDYDLGLKAQQGMASGAHKYITFGRNEKGNQYFHRWLEFYLGERDEKPVL
ncbi:SRPBCC family protein [Halopseudomonas sp. SMJS2]|uniref:aromatic ring-hydroxylating oxygenase subunit alpha n=1 Tax=Halopseudomonas sp. SMJS2 TaxID=3041098 RepID=UPI0024530D30|nr:SRPBCC family protein [Halopseudomonas sp. SMJS2]WGK62466.1 SRPBCC family protein [Halopseudomonas sp. SMJS2]